MSCLAGQALDTQFVASDLWLGGRVSPEYVEDLLLGGRVSPWYEEGRASEHFQLMLRTFADCPVWEEKAWECLHLSQLRHAIPP